MPYDPLFNDCDYLRDLDSFSARKKPRGTPEEPYDLYLRSPRWKALRAAALERDRTCRLCGSEKSLQAHHRSYRSRGACDQPGHESDPNDPGFQAELADLTILCRKCHQMTHGYCFNNKKT